MPKEMIHFTIAELTASLLADTRFAPCLKSEPDALLLGSIFHDVFFYAVAPGAGPIESLAHRLHGADGQDTFTLIRMQAEHAIQSSDNAVPASLLVGIISHVFADMMMHPLIWHLTGQYYADDPAAKSLARQHHRALESLMDMVVCADRIGQPRYSIRSLRKRCPDVLTNGVPLEVFSAMAGISKKETHKQLAIAWWIFSTLQTLLPLRPLAKTMFTIRPYLPKYVKEIASLFYAPQLMEQADFLKGDIEYHHPVSGDIAHSTLDALIQTAASMAEKMCRQLEPAIFDNEPLDLPETGPSMDAGLSGVSTNKMLHFAQSPFPKLP